MKKTKFAFFHSLIALLLCFSMLLGSTFAWFTESVSTDRNIITSGNIDLEMYWSDDPVNGPWYNIEDDAYNTIFSYDNWEPGYSQIKYIKLVNKGDLALNYQFTLMPEGAVGKLAEVIAVRFAKSAQKIETREQFENLNFIGFLNNVMNGGSTASGTILPAGSTSLTTPVGEIIMTLGLQMIPTAGNAYQNQSIGSGFSITAIASQSSYEEDSFGIDYDLGDTFDELIRPASGSVTVVPDNGKVPSGGAVIDAGTASATIPEGVVMADNQDTLSLTVTPLENTTTDITVVNSEILIPVDIHVEGVSDTNDVPIIVDLGPVMPKNLNIGNYTLIHVEDGVNNIMTAVADASQLTAHNTFIYDPLTGNISVALATFSEVAIIADIENEWQGTIATAFSGGMGTEDAPYIIANADQLAYMGELISNENEAYGDKHYKLVADINFGGEDNTNVFYPIGYHKEGGEIAPLGLDDVPEAIYEINEDTKASGAAIINEGEVAEYWYTYGGSFRGVFDGNGHTISNVYQNTWVMKGNYDGNYWNAAMGIFGYVYGGTIKNLTVDNFESDGEFTPTGVIAAYAAGKSTFENIAITKCNPRVYNTGNGGIIGIAGNTSNENDDHITLKNITVDNSNTISALWGSWDVACGGLVGMYRGNVDGSGNATGDTISFENCHVSAIIDVYNDVCANYQYYAYRYSGMIIGSVRHNTTNDDGKVIPNMTGISATGCTVNYGDWNDYYYCEFEKNTMASYSEDYQFSRVPHSELNFTDSNGNGVVDAGERASVTGCKHTHTAEENHQAIYLPFHQLFTGYSWGVSSIGLEKYSGIVTDLDITEGDQEESVVKFEVVENASKEFTTGTTIKIGNIFNALDGVSIKSSNINVFVSPVGDTSTASAIYTANTEEWTQGTLTFSGTGAATITISDYNFCIPTTVVIEVAGIEKFNAKGNLNFTHTFEDDGATIPKKLGDIFTAIEGANIDTNNITVAINEEKSTANADYTANKDDWTQGTLTFSGTGTVEITITDGGNCVTETATIYITNPEEEEITLKFPNTNKYVYRVGNQNAINLSSLIDESSLPDGAKVRITPNDGAVTYTENANWKQGTLKFAGTGIVTLTIDSNAFTTEKTLNLEVVNATNVTEYSELKEQNSVFLNDITMSGGSTYRLTGNKVLYGNGFTFDVKNGAYAAVQYDYQSYVIYLENSKLDNVKIEGAVYPQIGGTKADDYNRAIVMTNGNCTIENSYISNGASPIRNGGNLELIKTTLKGGIYANLDIRNGHVILDNVTTINQVDSNDKYNNETVIVGMGIVVYQEGGSDELKITIRNNLTQYNYLSEEQANKYLTNTYATQIKKVVFGDDFTDYQNNGWINFGIISMNNYFTEKDLVDERTDKKGYSGKSKTVSLLDQSRDCYVYTFKPESTNIPTVYEYTSSAQGIIEPTVTFDFTNKNYVAKTEGSNDYCYADGDIVYISMDEGDTFNWDTSILTVTKNGEELSYTVKMNNIDYTGKAITFNNSGIYTVVYSFTDPYNYGMNGEEIETFDIEYTKSITIEVSVVKAAAKHAEFSFGANGTAYNSKTVTIGDNTYVMPDVTATVSGKIGSKTVNGTTVYYPIVEMITSDGTTEHTGKWYACFPIFKDALRIIDYADKGTGDPVTYDETTVKTVAKIPSTLKVTNPAKTFLYSMNATNYPAPTDPYEEDDYVCYTCNRNGLDGGSNYPRKEETIVAEYTYTDNAGAVYYYYIGYHCAEQTKGSCVTPDMLITLADGSQKRVDCLTGNEELLVWNLETGKYDKAPIVFIDSESESEYEIIHLYFSDGSDVKVIYEHGFFDLDLGKYVYIDASNYIDYIGHSFVTKGNIASDEWNTATLDSVVIEKDLTTAWSPVTFGHLCYYTNGVLSMPGGISGLFNIFDVDTSSMIYDADKMHKDIETYGLFALEDFGGMITKDAFDAFNGDLLKIAIGKGLLTMEDIAYMAERYIPLM